MEINIIYVASPYSHPEHKVMEERYHLVMKYCSDLINRGQIPFSPIVYGHELAKKHNLPTDAKFWDEFNMSFLRLSRVLHVYCIPGWEKSVGVRREIDFATEIGIPIVIIPPLGEQKNGQYRI